MEDVAKRAGVSRALVSLVMRDSPKVSAERRAAVLEAAEELGYRPNASARSLASRRTATIGVVIGDLHNPFYAEVIDGIHDSAAEAQYQLMLNTSRNQDRDERRAVEAFLEYRLDGVIVLGGRMPPAEFVELSRAAPLVSIATPVDEIDTVVNDDGRGGELAVEHLLDLGHTDIVHIDGGTGGGAKDRRAGFVNRMMAAGLEPQVLPGSYDDRGATSAIEAMLARPVLPTAIFAANDLSAVMALSQLAESGVTIPDDVSVIGYDNTAVAALDHVSLTTIDQPRYEMGRIGFQCLVDRLADLQRPPVAHVVEPSLIRRRTTGPAPDGRAPDGRAPDHTIHIGRDQGATPP